LLTKQGKIQSELFVVAADDALWMATSIGLEAEVHASLDKLLVMEDVELEQLNGSSSWLSLQGPRATSVGQGLVDAQGLGQLDWTATGDVLVVLPADAEQALAHLVSQGAVVLDDAGWRALRVARACPEFGIDFDGKDNPHEAGIERRAVSWTKGCYLGQEVVCMQDMRGKVKRRVVSLEVEGTGPLDSGAEVASQDGSIAGQVTTSAHALEGGSTLALARLATPYFEGQQELAVGSRRTSVTDPK
jgi:folate-binding protein YgfZ